MATDQDQADTNTLRHSLRQQFRKKRVALQPQEQTEASLALAEQFAKRALFAGVKKAALYMTNDGELNTSALMDYLLGQNVKVFLPVLHPFSKGHLLFLQYNKQTPMQKNTYGILEPKLDCSAICPITELDLICVPLVAFDMHGNRLGMGGGFYDRTLASMILRDTTDDSGDESDYQKVDASAKPLIVGLAHDIQQVDLLPNQAWDIPLPYVLTPTQLYCF